jgi:hypothetical protein
MPGKKVNDHKANEAKKSSYSKGLKVNRGKEDYSGACKEEIEAWDSLNFKDFQEVDATINGATGFFIKNACGVHIFSALTEVLGS